MSKSRNPSRPNHHRQLDEHQLELREQRRAAAAERSRVQIRNGLLSIAGLLLMALIGWYTVARHNADVLAQQQAAAQRRNKLREGLFHLDLDVLANATRVVEGLQSTRDEWQGSSDTAEFDRMLDQARAALLNDKLQQQLATQFAALEGVLAQPQVAIPAWQEARAKAVSLQNQTAKAGPDLAAKAAALEDRIDHGTCDALLRDAEQQTTNHRLALQDLTAADDIAIAAAERKSTNAALATAWRSAEIPIALRIDVEIPQCFDAKTIESSPWTDLVPGTKTEDWLGSRNPALTHSIDHSGLHIQGPPPTSDRGAVLVLQGSPWRACEVACDVQLDSGYASLFARVEKLADLRGGTGVQLATAEKKGALVVPEHAPVHIDMVLLGDHLRGTLDTTPPQTFETKITTAERRGLIGITAGPGSVLLVSHLRVRKLARRRRHRTVRRGD